MMECIMCEGVYQKYLFASQEKDIYLFYTFYITRIRGQGAPDGSITRKGVFHKNGGWRMGGEGGRIRLLYKSLV